MNEKPWNKTQARRILLVLSYSLIIVIGVIDYLTGYELAFSPFYLFPVIFVTWLGGIRAGSAASVLSAVAWWVADFLTGHTYSFPVIYFYNTVLRLLNFMVVAYLVERLKREMENENQLARSDVITGIANARSFFEFLEAEVIRSARYNHPLTVAYIDLDNFKQINDRFGHMAGNQALRDTARVLRACLRRVDFVARIGGDEFALVLPETSVEDAPAVCARILACLMDEMKKQNWPVTFSMGGVTAVSVSGVSAEKLLQQADNLMYQVKRNGKNSLLCAAYTL